MKKAIVPVLVAVGLALLVAAVAYYYWMPSTRKLDEIVFYDAPRLKLKLVRYGETRPFQDSHEIFTVQCGSAQTAGFAKLKTQDAGWRILGTGGAAGSKSADELASRERESYQVIDENTLVWTGTVFSITFDGCGHFATWDPMALPQDTIETVPKPSDCAPQGAADCRYIAFQGDRQIQFDDVHITPTGMITFVARSKTFKPDGAVRVESQDHGRTWQLKQEHVVVPRSGLVPCPD